MKKLTSIVLTLIFAFSSLLTVSAADAGKEQTVEEMATDIALNWVGNIEPDLDLRVSGMIPLYDHNGEQCGYQVAFALGRTPYGYAIFDFYAEQLVTEFSIAPEVSSAAASVLENAGADSDIDSSLSRDSGVEVKLYKSLPFQYTVSVDDGDESLFYNNSGEMAEDEFLLERSQLQKPEKSTRAPLPDHFEDLIYTESQLMREYEEEDSLTIINTPEDLGMFTEEYAEDETGSYACAVMALINIASQEDIMIDNDFEETWDFLWDASYTETDFREDGITYGLTYDSDVGPALVDLADVVNADASFDEDFSPSYSDIRSCVNDDRSSIFIARAELDDGSIVGHSLSVVGYCSYSDDRGNELPYAMVADGWFDDDFKFICITDDRLEDDAVYIDFEVDK